MTEPKRMKRCEECNIEYPSYNQWYYHRRVTHGKVEKRKLKTVGPQTCEQCGKNFASYRSYYCHKTIKHGGNPTVKCKHCGQKFLTSHQRDRHFYCSIDIGRPVHPGLAVLWQAAEAASCPNPCPETVAPPIASN